MPPASRILFFIAMGALIFDHLLIDKNDAADIDEQHFIKPLNNYENHLCAIGSFLPETNASTCSHHSKNLNNGRAIAPFLLICLSFTITWASLVWIPKVSERCCCLAARWLIDQLIPFDGPFFELFERIDMLTERHAATAQRRVTLTYRQMQPLKWQWKTLEKTVDLNGREVYRMTSRKNGEIVYQPSTLIFELEKEVSINKYRYIFNHAWKILETSRKTGSDAAKEITTTEFYRHWTLRIAKYFYRGAFFIFARYSLIAVHRLTSKYLVVWFAFFCMWAMCF